MEMFHKYKYMEIVMKIWMNRDIYNMTVTRFAQFPNVI